LLEVLNDGPSLAELTAERTLVARLDASCRTPIGARASVNEGSVSIAAFVGLPDGSEWVRDAVFMSGGPEQAGDELADRLLAAGAAEVLARSEAAA
jgi:hydroxymethylbilane synthase